MNKAQSIEKTQAVEVAVEQEALMAKALEEEQLVKRCESVFEYYKRSRIFQERKWYLFYQFFRGNQWVDINRVTGELFVPPAPSWRVRLVINKTWVVIRNIASQITDKRPTFDVLPATDDPDDLENAKLIAAAIEYLYDKLGVGEKVEELVFYMLIFGVAYLKTFWDGEEIAIDVLEPFAVFFDPFSKDPQTAPGVIHATWRTTEYIKEAYGVDVPAESVRSTSAIQSRITNEVVGLASFASPTLGSNTQGKVQKDEYTESGAIVKEGYFRKAGGKKLEIVTWANGKLLKRRDLPYKHGRNPITKFVANRIPGEWCGISEVENLLPLQKELNKGRSQVIEHKNLMSRGKWLVPKNAGVSKNAFTSEPGEVIEYNPGAKPEQADLKPLPEYVFELLQWVERSMEDIAGIHDVSMGRIPTGAKSGRAIEALRESDETGIRPKERNLEYGLEKVGYQVVGLMQQYYTTEKLMRTTGKYPRFFRFSNKNIKEGVDVRVNLGTAFAYTRLGKREELKELYELGAIDRQTLLEHYEFGNVQEILERAAEPHVSKRLKQEREEMEAQEDITDMLNGEEPMISATDDHEIRIRAVEEYIAVNKKDFDDYPDNILEVFENYLSAHTAYMARQQMAPTGMPGKGGQVIPGSDLPPEQTPAGMTEDDQAAMTPAI